ncbi:GntT/GntP/DsdX family permease [Pedobacter sp. SAFR-022]|uniref:gluconate:H+ symporter n=1 Tax=Pedobacter sp. SAFR-022 TaxID=3436861 RepID=UPI003F815BC2
MDFLYVLAGIIILLILIIKKINPMLALLIASIATGLMLGMPILKVMTSVNNGIGSTLGSMTMVLALGAMIGKLAEDSGAAKSIVVVLIRLFGAKHIQWAVLITGILVGIPLFYNAGFVVLIPLVFAIAGAAKLPKLYVGIPMAAALSVTHGYLPPHPGPVALAGIFHADIGKLLIYGFILSIPIAIAAGIFFPRMIIKRDKTVDQHQLITFDDLHLLPPAFKSFIIALSPIVLITAGTLGTLAFADGPARAFFIFISDPTIALLIALFITLLMLNLPIAKAMDSCTDGVKGVAMILLIIAAGGAFKQILVDSGIGDDVKTLANSINASPLFLGWLIAALLRVTLGSATVAALTASGMVVPLVVAGASPELMVLAVGAGSLMFSHVNDTGFWMFKEYFGLSLKETFKTWTLMETIVSVLGIVGVLILNYFIY